MNKIKIKIWGREFNLNIFYEDEAQNQQSIIDELKILESTVLNDSKEVLDYCFKHNEVAKEEINIFKFVKPHYIYIPNNNKKDIILMCHYKFDIEHGLAIIYCDGKINRITLQDEIL